MKWILFLTALFPLWSENSSLTSTKADYDGNTLLLEGMVHLNHRLGMMDAESATLKRQEGGKEFPFSEIHLKKNVHLTLKNHAELSCESAHLDFTGLKGIMTSPTKVVYQDKEALRLMSPYLEFTLKESGAIPSIDTFTAREGVDIEYGPKCIMKADHALFQTGVNLEDKGTLTAFPKDPSSLCEVRYSDHIIFGKNIQWDLTKSICTMLSPLGNLSFAFQGKKSPLEFSAKNLIWKTEEGIVILEKHVRAENSNFGLIENEERIELIEKEKLGKKSISSLKAFGETILTHFSNQPETLTSPGTLTIDYEKGEAFAEGTKQTQLSFTNSEFTIWADHAHVEYSPSKEIKKATLLDLKGNIKMKGSNPTANFSCASCDRLSYHLLTQTLILSALPGKRTLFWNPEQNLRISGREVHITKDPLTKKDIVKGIGSVRFAFSLEENRLLNHLFPQYTWGPK